MDHVFTDTMPPSMRHATASPAEPKSAVKERLIKHHHKTRLGCTKCKERKIKCDEGKPACFNCKRSDNVCVYRPPAVRRKVRPNISQPPTAPSGRRSSSPGGSNYSTLNGTPTSTTSSGSEFGDGLAMDPSLAQISIRHPSGAGSLFDILHMELLHHWSTYTSLTLSVSPELKLLWRTTIVEIGLANEYALLMLLSLSARHLGRIRQQKAEHYRAVATNLQARALLLANAAKILPNVTEENCCSVIVFSSFVFINALAALPPDKETHDFSLCMEWLTLLRGVVQVTASAKTWLFQSDLAPLIRYRALKVAAVPAKRPAPVVHLDRLLQCIDQLELGPDEASMYTTSVQLLQQCFMEQHMSARESCLLACVFQWPARMTNDFKVALELGHPIARIIFAFYSILLAQLKPCWWVEGWPEYTVASVYESVDVQYRLWMQWPIEEVNWAPAT